MTRVEKIRNHPVFREEYARIQQLEAGRIYCHHDLQHFLDVARVGMILAAQEHLNVEAELLYAAALLHDLGRAEQIINGTPHHEASAKLAEEILPECGFAPAEIREVTGAILSHRKEMAAESPLSYVLYRADKESRPCYACSARETCNWPDEKKNLTMKW